MTPTPDKIISERRDTFYRQAREVFYRLIEPLDHIVRLINGKGDFPPIYLRRYVGPLRSFEMSGTEFMIYLRLIAKLKPGERILDIGCGCGLVPLYLKEYIGPECLYMGVDIHQPSITWCQRNITPENPHFVFDHIDVLNEMYNPKGRHRAENFRFPSTDNSFDLILLKSVFTHMRPAEVENYLKEIARLLSDSGRCLATFFLLNPTQEQFRKEGLNKLSFRYGDDTWRYIRKTSPESAIAFDEGFLREMFDRCGLTVAEPVLYGTWSGSGSGISYQDMILLQRK
ncbi:MAG TPA: methyltransferase domain-containing protein [Thermodesulfovibrionia bacterium]|nr:methyltransferase domain-containing protein [Thermodesulfovibrionia bacterium]